MASISITKMGPWKSVYSGLTGFSRAVDKTNKLVTKKVGLAAVGAIVKNIQSGGTLAGIPFAPNSEVTIALKKSSSPLINHGDLIGSINSQSMGPYKVFAGVTKMHPSGVNIAQVLHEGTSRAGRGNSVNIPPRPFIGDVATSPYLTNIIEKVVEQEYKNMIDRLFGIGI